MQKVKEAGQRGKRTPEPHTPQATRKKTYTL
jgi:hypothetical protein